MGLCVCPGAEAKTIALDGQQASIDVPDTWLVQPPPAGANQPATTLILAAVSAEQNAMVQIQAFGNPNDLLAAQPELIAKTKEEISNNILSHGGQVQFTAESVTSLNAVPAYLIQFTETTSASKQIPARLYQVAANGKLYLISLRTLDPANDAELQAIANSFRFDTPPVLPVPHAPVHRIRYILMAVAAVLVIIGLGVGFYFYRQRQLYE
jgi:hypothetical protein